MPKISFLVLLSVLLPACVAMPPAPAAPAPPPAPPAAVSLALTEAERAEQAGDARAASLAYERAGAGAAPAAAAEYRLRAAEQAVRAGEAERALQLAGSLPAGTLDSEQLARLQLARAESLLLLNQPYAAAEALPPSSADLPRLAARIEEVRARAVFASSEPETPPPPAVNAGGMALLLPLSGPLAASGESVRDGFLAAHFRGGARGRVQLYDAGGSNDSTLAAYQQALIDGAAVVIGPLRKEGVATIAQQGKPPVPVLALNYIEEAQAPPGLYQFGLAPEDEARTAAEHAAAQALRRAVALVPEADWGERALAAFRARLQALGGQVVDVVRYKPGQRDFSASVRTLLRAAAEAPPKPAPGAAETPARRQDVDLVFVVARPLEARLIMPMLGFYFASDLPTYATALAYDGKLDNDLAGLRFCDMPWILSDAAFSAERFEAAELPSQKRASRLFAFGYDAYALAAALQPGGGGAPSRLPGMTGTLGLAGNSAIRRGLQCAQVRNGALQLLEPVPASP